MIVNTIFHLSRHYEIFIQQIDAKQAMIIIIT